MKYFITEENDGILLSNFIKKKSILPISLLFKLLRKKKVLINNKVIKKNIKIYKNNILEILFIKKTINIQAQKTQSCTNYMDYENNIIYENSNFTIINKPYGISCQQGSKVSKSIQSALESFAAKYNKHKYFLIHRIDKYTSGLLVIGKNRKSTIEIQNLFVEKKIQKIYITIADNILEKKTIVDSPVMVDDIIKPAKTIFYPIGSNNNKTLILASIITGRKHQIRKHLLSINHPIVGDIKYNKNKSKYMYLHSFFMKIYNFNIIASLPQEFINIIYNDFSIKYNDLIKKLLEFKY